MPDPESQSGSQSRRGLGRKSLQIMRAYDLATAISIQPLTQPCTFEMGSSFFFAMSRLKFVSMTRASFLSITSNERGNGEFLPLLVVLLTVIILLFILPTSQEIIHRFVIAGIPVRLFKYEVDDGDSLAFL